MESICRYFDTKGECKEVLWGNNCESILILNYDTKQFLIIDDLKNMNHNMMSFIANDFKSFDFCDSDLMYITTESLNDIRKNANCGEEFINALKENDIEIREY